ncbi:scavenger receptor acting in neural tissue and majority of rhodopsin is absent [Carabus blaptoides fortunei]
MEKEPIPMALDFYFFNWTNPEDLMNSTVKPHVVEMGPYRFTETKKKVDIVWNNNGTVSFRHLRNWYFDEEYSAGSLTDEVTTLNAVAVTAAAQAKLVPYIMQRTMSMTMTISQKVHITKTVGELLFQGYEEKLIDMGRTLAIPGVTLPFDKFGWFYMRNGSTESDGLFNMGTGEGDIPLGRIDRWNHERKTPFYEGTCGRVASSAGEFWPQHITSDSISMFSTDMCREVTLDFDEEITVQGIKGYKFVGNRRTMDNGSMYPENECSCNGDCVPSGMLNISACKYGSPAFISFPHFYIADPYYVDHFDGLAPNKEQHEMSITLEPRTGIPLAVAARFQINILMTPNPIISIFQNVPKLFFPILWFEQEVVITDNLAYDLRQLVNMPNVARIIAYILISCGALILAILLIIHLSKFLTNTERNKDLHKTEFNREQQPLNESGINVQITAKTEHS